MADEATLRIVVKDEGGINDDAASPGHGSQSSSAALPPQSRSEFNPVFEAQKLREAESRRAEIKATYDHLYGSAQQARSTFQIITDLAVKMRGTMGGVFGPLVGSLLDVAAAVKAAQAPQHKAGGGVVQNVAGVGDNEDEVPIKATAGEFVVNKQAAEKPENKSVLEEINAGYSKGGEVEDHYAKGRKIDPRHEEMTESLYEKEEPYVNKMRREDLAEFAATVEARIGKLRLAAESPNAAVPESSLDIPRTLMPQIAKEHLPDFMKSLQDQGVTSEMTTAPVSSLHPSQNEIGLDKIAKNAMKSRKKLAEKTLIVSSDDYIVDGHHGWAGMMVKDQDMEAKIMKINLPFKELLEKTRAYDKVGYKAVGQNEISYEDVQAHFAGQHKAEGGEISGIGNIPQWPHAPKQGAEHEAGADLGHPVTDWMEKRYGKGLASAAGVFGQASTWTASALLTAGLGQPAILPPGTGMGTSIAVAEMVRALRKTREEPEAKQQEQPAYATGTTGVAGPPGVDQVNARLTAGEGVVTKAAMQNPANKAAVGAMNAQPEGWNEKLYGKWSDLSSDARAALAGSDTGGPAKTKAERSSSAGPWSLESTQQKVLVAVSRGGGSAGAGGPPNQADQGMGPLPQTPMGALMYIARKHSMNVRGSLNSQWARDLPTVTEAPNADNRRPGWEDEEARDPNSVPSATTMGKIPEAAEGGGILSMLEAAAPEIMAAGVIVKAVHDIAAYAVTGSIQMAGAVGMAAADPDANPAKIVSNIGGAVSSVGDKLLYINPLIGALGMAAGETATQLGSLMNAINATAERYGEYSPQIASAQAIAEIQQTMGDMRRGQEAGPELARYIQMQSDLQQKFEDIKIKVLLKILPIVTAMGDLLEKIVPSAEDIEPALAAIAVPLTMLVTVANQIAGTMEDTNRREVQDPTDLIINLRTGRAGPGLQLRDDQSSERG